MENQSSSTESLSSGTSENTTSTQANLLQAYIQSHESQKPSQSTEEVTHTGKHDAFGHCQQVVHVPAHLRKGHPVGAYDRLCGQKHTAKEAAEKNQEEAEEKENKNQTSENNPSENAREKYNELIKEYWPHLKENEGMKEFAYLDTNGKITTGMGLYIPDEKSFTSLPWQYQGKEATFEQKVAEYQRLEAFQKNGQFGKNYLADDFRLKNTSKELTLSDHFIIDKAMEHLEGDLRILETKYPEFENYPMSLQMALLDMQYNMGGNFSSEKWPSFHEGLRNKDITKMAEQSHRYQVGEDRNNWIQDTLLNIPLIDGWHYSSE